MNNAPHGPPGYDRERDREREVEDQRRAHALQQQQELAQREQSERQERERHREHYQPAPPHQNDTASIPLHQPVASRLPGAIHSPGGLLANHGGAPPPPAPLGAPSGPGNAFGGPLHSEASRPIQHNPQNATNQLQQQQGFGPSILHHNNAPSNVPIGAPGGAGVGFGGPLQQQQQTQQQQQQEAVSRLQQLPFGGPIPQGHQMPGAPALGQGGQQPILNVRFPFPFR
jgi:paired amphipathic helix protein Sin3a